MVQPAKLVVSVARWPLPSRHAAPPNYMRKERARGELASLNDDVAGSMRMPHAAEPFRDGMAVQPHCQEVRCVRDMADKGSWRSIWSTEEYDEGVTVLALLSVMELWFTCMLMLRSPFAWPEAVAYRTPPYA